MTNFDYNEALLLQNALVFEQGHSRRTRHLATVYAISGSLGTQAGLSREALTILRAAAILHDISIKYCKEKYNGDACQANQQAEAPFLIGKMLKAAHYPASFAPEILALVCSHHDYHHIDGQLQQLLIEADLIVNALEAEDPEYTVEKYLPYFRTTAGIRLFKSIIQTEKPQGV